MFPAFMDGKREIETADLVAAAGDMVPLAKSHHDRIAPLRQLHCRFQAGERVPIRGYQGNQESGEVVIDTGSDYDIGFQRQADQSFAVCTDWWGVRNKTKLRQESFLQEVKRTYALLAVKQKVIEQGGVIEGGKN